MGTADLRGGGHRGAPKRTLACPRTRSAVRRRPSLPRPVRPGPPDRHQQRRLAPSQATPRVPAVPSPPPKTSGRSRRVTGGGGHRERCVGQWSAGGAAGPPGVASGSGPLAASESL
ncbi:hypothetical protein EZV63_13505 [Streptomyces sp. VN1]|nr:hypothetical protein EZV63_13505 [Streptomyces sp. VN1]